MNTQAGKSMPALVIALTMAATALFAASVLAADAGVSISIGDKTGNG